MTLDALGTFLSVVFSRTTPEQFVGAFFVGIGFGIVLRAAGSDPRSVLALMLVCGFGFFTFVVVGRVLDRIVNPEVTIGTGLLWVPYAIGTRFGMGVVRRASTARIIVLTALHRV